MLRDIRSHQRGVRLIEVELDISEIAGKTLTKDGVLRGFEHIRATDDTGDVYTLTLLDPGVRPCMAWIQFKDNLAVDLIGPQVSATTLDSVELTNLLNDVYVFILAFDSPDET